MGACVSDIIEVVNTIAPFSLSEKWDNSGLQVGDYQWPVTRILVALDVTMAAMDEARKWNADLVLTHHPLMIKPEKSIDFGKMPGAAIEQAAKEKIAILSAHTNLDKARDGLNDYFAQVIGIQCDLPFSPDTDDKAVGIGRMGKLDRVMSLESLADQIKNRLKISSLRVAGDLELLVENIALCTGSGGSLTDHFLNSSAQAYITGDLKYHEARDIEAHGKAVIDVGHFASEHIVVDLLQNRLELELPKAGFEIEIQGFKKEKDPFKTI